ncbi:FAD-dependent oxidoreductase [Rhodobacter capsulatus]|jgi:NADH dehydrogenase|uniref:NADH dehydrogenase, cyclic nucleotide-regulated n=1 Tax=Rhodobacter capsulatus (strain ATCC BAA-309 / NBRC 16581 / SB1003) TaxID=272942 RepID=D5AN25_RHOCB|nr:FAD-dependent oxidoreductase [Rhodobacter capsulatus]ADE86315.1 NADH dehydrogenase, cyclic nucleotide-regulated [Rhodobacter capsulatus SB 1003]ETD82244.1 nucleotide-disulfide oxidoreductase [Rhodobacter capsulatus B6]MDS0928124.1 FAD-dependent oxidoreductase [Rhodobacter capsulatus]TQD33438.1 cyclic nucleotide-binding domain-containing protein [Rhodobacter capsulatus]
MATRIVVLGGGFGGMYTARALARRLGRKAEIELINAENYFVFQPLLPEVGAGSIMPAHAVSPLRFLLKGVQVRKAVVDSVDFERKMVIVFQGIQRRPTEVPYDHLVIALGQGADFSRMPGLEEHALKMKTLEDARRLREHVIEQLEHAQVTALPDTKRGALTFTVVGGGFSGVETVGEMKELLDRSLPFYSNIDPSEVRVLLVEYAPRILNEMPKELADYATAHLERHGIELKLGTGVRSATHRQLVTSDGEVIDTRTIVATIGNAPLPVILRMGLPLEKGRVAVDRSLRVKGRTDVWALGDCALIPLKDDAAERNDFAPPTAQFAVREAKRVAANITAVLKGRAPGVFAYSSRGALASLGAKRGVADIFGRNITGFPAWFIWRSYYLALLPGIGTRIRVMINWSLDLLGARSLVQLRTYQKPPMRHVYFRAGDRIYQAGDRSDGFYTVISGAVQMVRTDPDTGEMTTRVIGPGGHFGERLILGATRRKTSVHAIEDTKVLVMNRAEFLMLAESFEAFRDYFRPYMEKHGVTLPGTGKPDTPDTQKPGS